MADYYVRGPITREDFLLQARSGRVPYFATLQSVGSQEYVVFNDPRDTTRANIIQFAVSEITNKGVIITGRLRDRIFYLSTLNYQGRIVLAPSTSERTVLLPRINTNVRNFAVFLAGVPFTFFNVQGEPVSGILMRRIGGANKLELVLQLYALPSKPYYAGSAQDFPAIIDLELLWAQGSEVEPLYTNAYDSVQAIPYSYCKNSLCAPECKGGCSLSSQVCLVQNGEFTCINPSQANIPFYQTSLFLASAVSLGITLFLSILLLIAVLVIRRI